MKKKQDFKQQCLDVLKNHKLPEAIKLIEAIKQKALKQGWCINKDGLCEDDHCRCNK